MVRTRSGVIICLLLLGSVSDRLKGKPVDRAGAKACKGRLVGSCAIAFMLSETIARIHLSSGSHQPAAADLGDDRSSGYRKASTIATDQGELRHRQLLELHCIYQQGLRGGR